MKQVNVDDCYLCGRPLTKPIDDDHVPPSMFFAKALRKDRNFTKLLTIPVHVACNRNWQCMRSIRLHVLTVRARLRER